MTKTGVVRSLRLAVSHPSVFLGRRGYVFILSHMRSYSSLLAHALGSHPEIDGYAEAFLSYERRRDLLRLRSRVARSLAGPLAGRFVLDKILHDGIDVCRELVVDPVVRPIFLVRHPADAIPSIVKMTAQLPDTSLAIDEEHATTYYVQRLATLERLGEERGRDALVLRAECLIDKSEATLERIRRFLGLATPIESTYATFPLTGRGAGDFSAAIQQRRIQPRTATAPTPLRPDMLELAEQSYAHCLEALDDALAGPT